MCVSVCLYMLLCSRLVLVFPSVYVCVCYVCGVFHTQDYFFLHGFILQQWKHEWDECCNIALLMREGVVAVSFVLFAFLPYLLCFARAEIDCGCSFL